MQDRRHQAHRRVPGLANGVGQQRTPEPRSLPLLGNLARGKCLPDRFGRRRSAHGVAPGLEVALGWKLIGDALDQADVVSGRVTAANRVLDLGYQRVWRCIGGLVQRPGAEPATQPARDRLQQREDAVGRYSDLTGTANHRHHALEQPLVP